MSLAQSNTQQCPGPRPPKVYEELLPTLPRSAHPGLATLMCHDMDICIVL